MKKFFYIKTNNIQSNPSGPEYLKFTLYYGLFFILVKKEFLYLIMHYRLIAYFCAVFSRFGRFVKGQLTRFLYILTEAIDIHICNVQNVRLKCS